MKLKSFAILLIAVTVGYFSYQYFKQSQMKAREAVLAKEIKEQLEQLRTEAKDLTALRSSIRNLEKKMNILAKKLGEKHAKVVEQKTEIKKQKTLEQASYEKLIVHGAQIKAQIGARN